MQKILIITGIALLLAGLIWPWLINAGLGRLPGDLIIRRDGFTLYLPITTMILVSALLSLALWWLRK